MRLLLCTGGMPRNTKGAAFKQIEMSGRHFTDKSGVKASIKPNPCSAGALVRLGAELQLDHKVYQCVITIIYS